jgi:two-component system response regulator QseB
LRSESFELVILDLGLPRLSGLKLLQHIRQQGDKTPVIILTAQDSIDQKIQGLDMGADDYMIKPFDLSELNARIRALVRRSQGRADTVIQYKNITLDPAAHSVMLDNEFVNIPRREFALLQKLIENQGQAISRDQLMQSIYGWEENVDSNVLEVHIHNLRKKLDASFIRTIRGIGYMTEKHAPSN